MTKDEAEIRALLAKVRGAAQRVGRRTDCGPLCGRRHLHAARLPHRGQARSRARSYRAIFGTITLSITFAIDEVVTADSLATALTRSDGSVRVNATGTTAPESNREVFVFAREGGTWRIARYLFNKAA
ncbi:MAG: nuclear transport factor 2 family protein [Gemmatimonadales bacterium]